MFMFKKFIKEWYVLNKTQRRGTIVLFILFLCTIVFKIFYVPEIDEQSIYFANIQIQSIKDSAINKIIKVNSHKDSLFLFNPNTVTEDEMRMIGFPDNLIKNVLNYRKAGGKFYSARDFRKLYTINDSIYNVIATYILIEKEDLNSGKKLNDRKKDSYHSFKSKVVAVELNSTDSLELERLKGIGKVLAARIIKYRNKIGGYYSVKQLREVYGITDSLYTYIISKNKVTVDARLIKKINISKADFKTMIRHPYLGFDKNFIIKVLQMQKQTLSENKLKEITPPQQWEKLKYYIEY